MTAASVAALLDPDEWEVGAADEDSRTVAKVKDRGAELHDVVVRAVRRSAGASCRSTESSVDASAATIESPQQRRQILIGVCTALMAVISSVSGLNVAQRQIAVALDASQSEVLWMINIYAVTLAALSLPLGAVGNR